MSVHVVCDRCQRNTNLYFLNATISIERGMLHEANSKVHPSGLPVRLKWHLCETCANDLRTFRNTPARGPAEETT